MIELETQENQVTPNEEDTIEVTESLEKSTETVADDKVSSDSQAKRSNYDYGSVSNKILYL